MRSRIRAGWCESSAEGRVLMKPEKNVGQTGHQEKFSFFFLSFFPPPNCIAYELIPNVLRLNTGEGESLPLCRGPALWNRRANSNIVACAELPLINIVYNLLLCFPLKT